MIGRSAGDRQAQRDVHRVLEMECLDRDERLIVVHAERGVVAGACPVVEHGVGWMRARDPPAFSRQRGDCRLDDFDFLPAELTGFSRVRVESRDGEPRLGNAEMAL